MSFDPIFYLFPRTLFLQKYICAQSYVEYMLKSCLKQQTLENQPEYLTVRVWLSSK